MKRHLLGTATLLVPLSVIAAPGVANAAPPESASGTVEQTSFVVTGTRTAGGVTFFTFTETDSLSGAFAGNSTISGECIQRATGPILCKAEETFTGTVLGRSGTVDLHDLISIDPTTGAIQGSFVSVAGTGELSGAHTHGTFTGQGTSGTYSGTVVFTP
jgi:hypothetical protein